MRAKPFDKVLVVVSTLAMGIAVDARIARADGPPPLPPPDPPAYDPSPQPQPQPQPRYQADPSAPSQQPQQPPLMYAPPPPPVLYNEPDHAAHAPKFSLWVGGRLGLIGYGGNFYDNQNGQPETTGNFVRNGLSLEVDVGARLGKRYIPYIALELAGMAAGHRFEGADAKASTSFLGVGFRYLGGDVDSVAFASDLSVGIRTVQVTSGADTYKMSSLEILRLGLGAEIRISTLFTLSPMFTLSGGSMTDTDGTINFSQAGSGDGITSPTYVKGAQINRQRGYTVVGLGCGGHFDFFGK